MQKHVVPVTADNSNKPPRFVFIRLTSKQPTVFSESFLDSLEKVTADFYKIGNNVDTAKVEKVSSILDSKTLENGEAGLATYPLIKSKKLTSAEISEIKHRVLSSKAFMQDFVSSDYKQATVVVQYKSVNLKSDVSMSDQVDEVLSKYKNNFSSIIHLSQAKINSSTLKSMAKEGPMLVGLALTIMLIFFAIMTKKAKVVVICFLVMVLNMVLSFGVMGYCGLAINIVSSCVPIVIVVIGSTESVHIVCSYIKGMIHYDNDSEKAMEYVIKNVYFSTIMTSLTTTVGFLSFGISSSYAIREFGYEGAIAMAICGLVALFFIPVLLAFIPLKSSRKLSADGNTPKDEQSKYVESFTQFLLKHSTAILTMLLIVFVASIYAIKDSKVDMAIFDVFTQTHPDAVNLKKLRNDFGGIASMKVVVSSKEADEFLTPSALKKLRAFSRKIKKDSMVSSTVSVADVFSNVNRKLHDDKANYNNIPSNEDELEQITNLIDFDNLQQLINDDFNKATIIVRFKLLSKYDVENMSKQIKSDGFKIMGSNFKVNIISRFDKQFAAIDLLVKEGCIAHYFVWL